MDKVVFTTISLQEFEDKISQIVENKIKPLFTKNSEQNENYQEVYLTRQEVATLFRISLPTLNNYTKQGIIQGHRMGRRVLYKKNEVEGMLQEITSTKYKRKDLSI